MTNLDKTILFYMKKNQTIHLNNPLIISHINLYKMYVILKKQLYSLLKELTFIYVFKNFFRKLSIYPDELDT